MIKSPEPETEKIKNVTPDGEYYEGEPAPLTPLIVVKQLPVIEERLKTIKQQAESQVEEALALVCTEDSLKSVKETRAALRKTFAGLEDNRKSVKRAVFAPYEAFEAVYKECITDIFKPADEQLKSKIDEVENALKDEKKAELAAYFNEYLASKGIDFVTFECSGINVTRSASMKSLKEQAKAFVDRICEDLSIIDIQDHKDEILYHYKKIDGGCYLNASRAIQLVTEKNKAIEAEKARQEELKSRAEAERQAVEKVNAVVESLAPPTVEEPELNKTQRTKYELSFKVSTYDIEKLRALKQFMEKEGIEYEQL